MTALGDALARMAASVTTWRTDDGRTYRQVANVAYYGHPDAARLLVEGIPLEDECGGCPDHHICLGWSPELSANFGPVLEVDVTGLPVVWDLGEGRIHEPIDASRVLRLLPGPIKANWDGWEDPALRTNHRECLRRYALSESRDREPEAAPTNERAETSDA